MLQVLDDAQVEALVSAPDGRAKRGKRDKALLAILAYGGLRIAEACSLKVSEVQRQGSKTRLVFAGKGGRVRTVSLPQKAAAMVLSHLATNDSPFLFPGRHGPLTARGGRLIVTYWVRKAGLPDWVHPHTLRHSYGTKLIKQTGDLFLVSRVMGHANISTTAAYYLAFDPSYADRAAEAMG